MDYADVVVHLFQGDSRALYDLDGLWMDAARLPVPKRLDNATGFGRGGERDARKEETPSPDQCRTPRESHRTEGARPGWAGRRGTYRRGEAHPRATRDRAARRHQRYDRRRLYFLLRKSCGFVAESRQNGHIQTLSHGILTTGCHKNEIFAIATIDSNPHILF